MTEVSVIAALQSSLGSPFGRALFVFLARWLVFVIAAACVASYAVEREPNHRHALKELFWSVGLAALATIILSTLVGRARPYVEYPAFVQAWITPPSTPFSLPSLHSAIAWAWAASATHLARVGAPLWFLAAALVSLGRVVVGVHFPSDVALGALIGTLAYTWVHWGHRWLRSRPSV